MNGNIEHSEQFKTLPDVRFVRKTADETVNNSNVLQDDNELFVPLQANEVFHIRLCLRYNTSATADLKIKWKDTGGLSSFTWGGIYLGTGGSSSLSVDLGVGSPLSIYGAAGVAVQYFEAIGVNGAAADVLTLQWAQNTAEVSDSKVLTNSFIEKLKYD